MARNQNAKTNELDLEDIVSAANVNYQPLKITVAKDSDGNKIQVDLLPFLVLSEEKQDEVTHLINKDEDGEDEEVTVLELFRRWAYAVAASDAQADLLISSVGDKGHVWKTIQEFWIKETQPGEAAPSRK